MNFAGPAPYAKSIYRVENAFTPVKTLIDGLVLFADDSDFKPL